MPDDASPVGATGITPGLMALYRELGDLKRIRSADAPGSIAERLFHRAWAALAAGEAVEAVMVRTSAAALASARLGDLDAEKLQALGLGRAEVLAVLQRAFDAVAAPLAAALAERLRAALDAPTPVATEPPAFALALARQPRAGVTCPGKPRILLQPAESHAEHCLIVGVYGVIGRQGGDPAQAFLAGLAHHFHNVSMPDSGFTGEALLGEALDRVVAQARESVLTSLAPGLQALTRAALAPIGGDATSEARAFHVADVLDRVLEIEQHLRAAHLTLDEVLGPYALVHDGPVRDFHGLILREAGLHA